MRVLALDESSRSFKAPRLRRTLATAGSASWSSGGTVALIDVTFFGDQRTGAPNGPTLAFAAEKVEFGSSWIKRCFDREWKET